MCNSKPAIISKQILLNLEGRTEADFRRALETALDELKHGTRGGAGGNGAFSYSIHTCDVSPTSLAAA